MPDRVHTIAQGVHSKTNSLSFSTKAAIKELERALQCKDDVLIGVERGAEGALSGIAVGYLAHADPARIRVMPVHEVQPRLGETVVFVQADPDLAIRIYDGFERAVVGSCKLAIEGSCPGRCSGSCVRRIIYASASDEPSMPEALHRYMRKGFKIGPRIKHMLSHEDIAPLCNIARSVSSECERTRQFVRFSKLHDGSYFSVFRPKADTIPLTASYFKARIGNERFCLLDPIHKVAAFYDKQLAVVRLDDASIAQLIRHADLAVDEHYVQSMWKLFYDKLALEGRERTQRGYDLRCQLMPKRLWEGLPELNPQLDNPLNTGSAAKAIPTRYAGTTQALPASLP